MIVRSLWSCAAIIMVLAFFAASACAAEIGCASIYGEKRVPEFPSDTGQPEAQRLWPSGVRPTPDTCKFAFIHGNIIKGDYEKFLVLYRKNHPFLDQVSLDSQGGDADEAIRIGRLCRRYLIMAVSPTRIVFGNRSLVTSWRTGKPDLCDGPDCLCASSCALIWFGAPDLSGRIGLHRPRTEDPAFKALAPAEAAQAYRRMLDGIVRYLEEMETPNPLIEAMVSTSSAEIHWFEIETSGQRAPSFAEWVDASCGQFTTQESEKMIQLDVIPGSQRKLSQTEEFLHTL